MFKEGLNLLKKRVLLQLLNLRTRTIWWIGRREGDAFLLWLINLVFLNLYNGKLLIQG